MAQILDADSAPPSLELAPGYRAYAFKPASMDETTNTRLKAALISVSTRAFGADMEPYWDGRDAAGFFDRVSLFSALTDSDGTMVGWSSCQHLSVEGIAVLYLDSTGVLPELQSTGLIRALMTQLLPSVLGELHSEPRFICARTESPVVYSLFITASS